MAAVQLPSTQRLRIPGAIAAGLAIGLIGWWQAPGSSFDAVLAGAILGVAGAATLYAYWIGAPRLGRATTLAALSVAWGALLTGLSFGVSSGDTAEQTAAYGLSGVLLVWLVAALCIPTAGAVRFGRKLVTRLRAKRDERVAVADAPRSAAPKPKRGRVTPKGTRPRQTKRQRASRP